MAIKRIGVVGSGIMGAGVAEVAAASGFEVVLRSRTQAGADAMLAGLDASLARQVKKGRLEDATAAEVRGRVSAVTALDELAACDLVLESIVEDLADQAGALRRARPGVHAVGDPRHQHVDVARSSRWPW